MTVTVQGFLEAQLDRIESDLAVTPANIGRQAPLRGEKGFVLWLMEGGGPATFQELQQTLLDVVGGGITPPRLALARQYARDLLPRIQAFL